MSVERSLEPTPAGIIGEYLRHARVISRRLFDQDNAARRADVSNMVNAFGIVALMAELERVAPERAAEVARQLVGHWEDGSTVFEYLGEWHDAFAAGLPVGFADGAS